MQHTAGRKKRCIRDIRCVGLYSPMKRPINLFAFALLLSLLLHAALFLPWAGRAGPAAQGESARIAMEAVLVTQHAPALILPEEAAPPQAAKTPPAAGARTMRKAQGAASVAIVRQAAAQVARSLLYPPEAIARGLEGEARVLLFLDGSGNVVAARLERTSGHAILDEAAVRAARSVHALPGAGAREVLLPVRFRLE